MKRIAVFLAIALWQITGVLGQEIESATKEISGASSESSPRQPVIVNIPFEDMPPIVAPMLPAHPKLEDYIAMRNILTASSTANVEKARQIAEDNAKAYEEYRKISLYIARLQAMLVDLNYQIVAIDQERNRYEEACAEQRKARLWVDSRIRESEEAKAAGIPEDVTDFVSWLEEQKILVEDEK